MQDGSSNVVDITRALRDQLALISVLVLFAGIRFIEAYYWQFGIALSTIDFSVQYLIYRGLLAVFESPWIGVAYLGCVVWLAFAGSICLKGKIVWLSGTNIILYSRGVSWNHYLFLSLSSWHRASYF